MEGEGERRLIERDPREDDRERLLARRDSVDRSRTGSGERERLRERTGDRDRE